MRPFSLLIKRIAILNLLYIINPKVISSRGFHTTSTYSSMGLHRLASFGTSHIKCLTPSRSFPETLIIYVPVKSWIVTVTPRYLVFATLKSGLQKFLFCHRNVVNVGKSKRGRFYAQIYIILYLIWCL